MSEQPPAMAAVPNGNGKSQPTAASVPGSGPAAAPVEDKAVAAQETVPAPAAPAAPILQAEVPAAAPAVTPEKAEAAVPVSAPAKAESPAPPPTPAPAAPAAVPAAAPAVKSNFALVIDDEPANRDFLVRLLQQAKLDVHGASTAAEALQIAKDVTDMALVVIDNKLPDMNGVDLLIQFRPRYPSARIVMATMLDERQIMVKAFENGCDVFLVKPHGFMELFRRLQMPDTPGESKLSRLIIDQYGPRPYRG
jgi:CheY-like chemotaxis protein